MQTLLLAQHVAGGEEGEELPATGNAAVRNGFIPFVITLACCTIDTRGRGEPSTKEPRDAITRRRPSADSFRVSLLAPPFLSGAGFGTRKSVIGSRDSVTGAASISV